MDERKVRRGATPTALILLLGLAILLGEYALLRFGGWWGEGDTAAFTKNIAILIESGELINNVEAYQHGYGYPVLASWLITFTELPVGALQIAGGMLLMGWMVVPAWLAYRELTQSELAASFSALILLIQPELLFPLLRGTHEKFTRGLMFICLYLLLRSLRSRGVRLSGVLVICFYLCAYAMICFNAFMATSFILSILVALGLVWAAGRWKTKTRPAGRPVVSKLIYVAASLQVIAFIFVFYAYPPAQRLMGTLIGVGDRLAMLALQVEEIASNPYQVVNRGWISTPVYWLVSLANWILLGGSLGIWLKQSYAWLLKRSVQLAWHDMLLWAFYAAFAFLGFISILVDMSGAIAANLQHRMFPSFVMLAAPVAGAWLAQIKPVKEKRAKSTWARVSILLGTLMVLSVFKATNEPLLSNTWLFSIPGERTVIEWAEQTLTERGLWTGPGGRITDNYMIWKNGIPPHLELDSYTPLLTTHDYLVSDVTHLQVQRLNVLLPIEADSLTTYDNGTTQIYHRRPVTPFQK